MKKLATLALIVALGACKSSSDTKASKTESEAAGESEQTARNGRSGKIELPSLKPGGGPTRPEAAPGDRPSRGDRAERMKKFDTDGDGQLSEAELEAMRDARRDRMMERLDTDGDGKISEAERAAGEAAREAERAKRDEERLKRQDTDGDGKVSDAERAAAESARAQDLHDRLDADGDGKLTTAELAAGRRFRGDATKADTNGDGVISADELAKSMEASRGSFRGRPGGYQPR